MKILKGLSLVAVSALLASCATIISGQEQTIHIKTMPTGKKYTVDINGQKVVAPTIVKLKRENKEKIIKVEDCPGEEIMLKPRLNVVTLLNIISGGGVGLTTDYFSGALWEYEPSEVKVGCPTEK